MAAQANLTLNDGQASPVPQTFSARGVKVNTALYRNVSSGIAIGQPQLTLSVEETKVATKVTTIILLPTLEVISGADGGYTPVPKVAYSHYSKCEDVMPNRGTLAERKNLRAFRANLGDHAVYMAAVQDNEAVW